MTVNMGSIQSTVTDVNQTLRLRFVKLLLLFLAFGSFGSFMVILTGNLPDMQGYAIDIGTFSNTMLLISAASLLGLYSVYQNRHTDFIANTITLSLSLFSFVLFDQSDLLVLFIIVAVTNALLSGNVTYRVVIAILTVKVLLQLDFEIGGITTIEANSQSITNAVALGAISLIYNLAPLVVGTMVRIFTNTLRTTIIESQRTANLLEASATVGQIMSRYLTVDELMNQAVMIIRDRFGFYHVQIFVVDEDEQRARLTASTGEVGKQLLDRKHSLALNSQSIIGRTVQAAEPVVARDTQRSQEHAFNPLLPNTRAELGVPIMDGRRVIGAVDVQSMRVEAFTPTEIQALQVMAGQLATAIRNAQLFEQQESNVRENQRLLFDAEANLREIQRLNRQLTRKAWEEYLAGEPIDGVTLAEKQLRPGADWSDGMKQASQKRRAIVEMRDDKRIVSVPIELRNEIVGALEVELDNQQTEEDAVDLLVAVANRLAISLDNARLFEETQEISAQEQRLNELVAQYQSADSVDDLLRITLRDLAETLGAEHGAIRLGGTSKPNGTSGHGTNGHGGQG